MGLSALAVLVKAVTTSINGQAAAVAAAGMEVAVDANLTVWVILAPELAVLVISIPVR